LARLNLEEAAAEARRKEKTLPKMSQMEKLAADMALLKVEKAAEVALTKVEKAAEVALIKVEANAIVLQKAKLTADLLLEEKEAAESATRTKSQFLANMSHELRTPMTGVLGMLDLVLTGNLEAEQREFIETAQTSARSLVRILNDILDLTKIEAGKLSIEAKQFSVRKCLEATHNILLPVARTKRLDLDFTVADDVPVTLVGDQTRLIQILTNLAGNAVKFTIKGKVELRVRAGGRAMTAGVKTTSPEPEPVTGFPKTRNTSFFTSSARWTIRTPAFTVAPAWGSPSVRRSSNVWGGRSASRAKRGKGAHFPVPSRSVKPKRGRAPSLQQRKRLRQRTPPSLQSRQNRAFSLPRTIRPSGRSSA